MVRFVDYMLNNEFAKDITAFINITIVDNSIIFGICIENYVVCIYNEYGVIPMF